MNKPNILFINTDQHSQAALSVYGNKYVNTPNIDRLHRNGISFHRAYCTDPVCSPARSGWVTGRYSSETGVVLNGAGMNRSIADLGALLNGNGYYAAHCGKWHVGDRDAADSFHTLYTGKRPISAGGADYYDSAITHAALEFLSGYEADRPFYLQVDYINPHDICEYLHNYEQKNDANPEFASIAERELLPPLPANFHYDHAETILQIVCRRIDDALIHSKILQATKLWTELQWRYYIWNYYRFIEKVDREIGLLLNGLEQTPFKDNTIILFSSDHGEACASHQMFQKFTLYEESIRVPLIVSCLAEEGNGVPKGVDDYKHLVSGVDILPTVCDYAGIPVEHKISGSSIKPIVEGAGIPWNDYVYVESNYWGRAIVTEHYKYVMEYIPADGDELTPPHHARNRRGLEQLFDLFTDPGETINLATRTEHQEMIQDMRRKLADKEDQLTRSAIVTAQTGEEIKKWAQRLNSYREQAAFKGGATL